MQEKKLSDLVPGDVGVVVRLHDSVITSRLTEMGLFKGKRVTVLFQAPFNGPIAVDVDGYVLSLRTEEAGMVEVSNYFSEN